MKQKLINLLNNKEAKIIDKLIDYAKVGGFTRYNSTRQEDWLVSVREIITGLTDYLYTFENDIIGVDDNYLDSPVVQFGIDSARRHRARGITLKMFLSLFKYYRRAYLDIVNESDFSPEEKTLAKRNMNTYFDRFELSFCSEWSGEGPDSRLKELQGVNRILTNEKNKLRTIFESMTECVFVVDPDMKITEINSAAAAYFGVNQEDVIGRNCCNLMGCDKKIEQCQLYQAMRTGGCYKGVEVEITTKKGKRHILTSGSFLHDISGKYAGGVQVFVDVTERYNMEQALRLHMQANNSSSDCVTIFDHGAQLIYANPVTENILGRSINEIMGLGIEELYQGGDKILLNLIRGDLWRGELKLINPVDNRETFVNLQANPIKLPSGNIIGFHVAARDITLHKVTQIKLQEAKEETEREAAKLRAIVSVMQASIALADANDIIKEVNEQCEIMTGKTRAELIGKSLWELHVGEILNRVRQVVEDCKNKSNHPSVSITRRLGNMDVIMNIQPIYRDHTYDGILLMVVDVSEVAEAKRQAELAKEFAEKASESKSEFLANMSHEIRTPMNGILGFAEVLLQQNLNFQQEESVKVIQKCGEQLMELINDILDLSKIESGKFVLEETSFSLRRIIHDALSVVEPRLSEKDVEIKVTIDQKLPDYYKGDPTRICQVLNNLLANAVKFTHEGFVEVNISGEQFKKEENEFMDLKFFVADSGIGITEEKLSLIFEAFTQADGSTTRKYGGTGLGLAISRSLTELMGGKISVESEVNRGSKFTFNIPTKIEHNLVEEDKSEKESGTGVVLVVEDDWTTKQLIANYLEKAGYSVISTEQGKQALTMIKIYKPDVIILDILLPDMNGWEILDKIKKGEDSQQIPVIVCSVLPEKERAFSLGAVDFIEKPISERVLVSRIKKLTMSRRSDQTHIVLVDDDKTVLEFLKCTVGGAGYKTHDFIHSEQALKYIFDGGPVHAVILDLLMPNMDGFEFLDRLRMKNSFKDLPVLINTGMNLTQEDYKKLNDKYEKILNKSFVHPDVLLKEIASLVKNGVARKTSSEPNITGKVNVLLVEDNQYNQKLIEHLLAGDGYNVKVVGNGEQALNILEQESFDIILMDMQMPVMDGYEATKRIRNSEKHNKIPVIALTAYAMKGDNEKCLAAGCDSYLSKPVKKDILANTIKQYVQSTDVKASKKIRDRDKGVESLVPWYLQDLAGEIDRLKLSAKVGDLSAIRYISHGLKGSGGAYGFPEISTMGAEIERAAINNNGELAKELVKELRDLYTKILEEEL